MSAQTPNTLSRSCFGDGLRLSFLTLLLLTIGRECEAQDSSAQLLFSRGSRRTQVKTRLPFWCEMGVLKCLSATARASLNRFEALGVAAGDGMNVEQSGQSADLMGMERESAAHEHVVVNT